jgi:hypothetical protein
LSYDIITKEHGGTIRAETIETEFIFNCLLMLIKMSMKKLLMFCFLGEVLNDNSKQRNCVSKEFPFTTENTNTGKWR